MNHLRADAPLRLLLAGANPQEHKHDVVRRGDIAEGFVEVLGKPAVATCRYESVARQILRDRPELVLLIGSILPDRCDYAAMRRSCDQVDARLAFWLQYDPYEFDAYVKIVGLADFIFSNDRWATTHYPRTAVWHLPLAASARPLRRPTSAAVGSQKPRPVLLRLAVSESAATVARLVADVAIASYRGLR